jgi:hypothetical protein
MAEEKVLTEELKVTGAVLLATIKGLIHAGNVRRITIKNSEGKTLIVIPLMFGVIGALLLPWWAAIGAIAALAAQLTIVVEKVEEAPPAEEPASETDVAQ